MASKFLDQFNVTPLPIIQTDGGNLMKGLLQTESSYNGFGEAYFSEVFTGAVKAWKCHRRMTLNLLVPVGKIKFVFCDKAKNDFAEIIIGSNNYARLTVKPGIWFGFQGMDDGKNLLLNIADILHDPEEVDRLSIDEIKYNW